MFKKAASIYRYFTENSNVQTLDGINAQFKETLGVITEALNNRPERNTLQETAAIADSLTKSIPHVIDAIKEDIHAQVTPNAAASQTEEPAKLRDVNHALSTQIIHLTNARKEMTAAGVEITRELHTALNALSPLQNALNGRIQALELNDMPISNDIAALTNTISPNSLTDHTTTVFFEDPAAEEASAHLDKILGTHMSPSGNPINHSKTPKGHS